MDVLLMLKVAPNTITLRMSSSQIGVREVAKKFGITEPLVYMWVSGVRNPSKRKCPHCQKSLHDLVENWINDGTIK